MIPAQPTPDEAQRIKALRQFAILDTLPEQALDDLTTLAAQICGAPMATISLVDEDRQWFKAKFGMEVAETPRDISFCGHTVHQRDLLIVPDATLDERFTGNPLVIGEPGIRFYAGAPLITSDNTALGALCVMDRVPHTLTQEQKDALQVLGRQVMTHLELHRYMHELVESEKRLQIVTNNARVGLVIIDQERRYVYANNAYIDILDLPSSAIVGQLVSEVLSGIYEKQIRSRLDCAFAGERVVYEQRKPAKEGDCHYEVKCEPTKVNGKVALVVVVITDITERKQAEAESRTMHTQLQHLLEHSPVILYQLRIDGEEIVPVVVSENIQRLLGVSVAECMSEGWWRKNLYPDDKDRAEETLARGLKEGGYTMEYRVRHRDGTYRDIEDSSRVIRNASGKPTEIVGAWTDITERKRAEEVMRGASSKEAGRRKRSALVDMAVIIVLSALVFIVGLESDVFDSLFRHLADEEAGIDQHYDEMAGTGIFFCLALLVFSYRRWREGRKEIGAQAQISNALLILHGELEKRVQERTGELVKANTALQAEVTENKRAQEQIAEQAAFLDKAQDAILVRDLEGKILFWNKGAERMYGWTPQEAIGRNIVELLYAHPSKFKEVNGETIREGEWSGELHHLTKDRGEITIEARWTLVRDNEGRPKSILAINTDITEKKKIEVQFMRAQRMESIGTLAGGIAHDLNNILSPIMMSIDILKTMSENPQSKEILDTIEISAKRGADIVRQVLSFARGIEGERIEIQPKHLLKDLETIIKDTFPKDIHLRFSTPRDIWTISGDATQVHQILLNLCVNARDAMPNGGNLTIGVENCVLDEHYAAMNIQAKPGRYVIISVTDSGTGMPPELIDKIFEPFFTTKDLNKGTGLGLSTVMAIVKSHGGVINVYSEPGKGTTFKVYLPAMESLSEAQKGQSEQASLPRGNGETILVVDDEASILTITSQTLQAFGYRVLTATDGADALSVYVQHRKEIAVVLTDMMMPVMAGPPTILALMRINPAIKIIAASGLNANGGVAKVSSAGIKHFLPKPYTAGTLLKEMRAILEEP